MSGETTTSALSDSLETLVFAARYTRDHKGVMTQLADKQTLDPNKGITWNEVTLGQVTAGSVTETTRLNNPQQVTDSNFPVTPTVTGLHMVFTDRMKRRISKLVYAQLGQIGQMAIQRKKDQDGLMIFDGFTSLGGAGTTMQSGLIAAAAARILGNATEPGEPPIYAVVHPYQAKDMYDELTAGVGTYPIPAGVTADTLQDGFKLGISGVTVYQDGLITVDSASDAKGGVFAKKGIVQVQGKPSWTETKREPDLGGGADSVYLYDEHAWAERLAAGTTSAWGFELYSDATAPSN